MPHSTPAAHVQPQPGEQHPRSATRRVLLTALAGVAMLMPVSAMAPQESAAAGGRSCTGWTSTTVPPETIRVGRSNGTGPVQTVSFRRYVAVVMAKEWPSYLPQAAIEAGALAVKQYAWYHAMAGRHRSSFRTASGNCFDVVDSTRDQLYKPEQVRIHSRIWSAVDATWLLSVRKGGSFFMTGYRAGSSRNCGADADGWRLFARSVIDCARRGLSGTDIARRYYGSNVKLVWAGQAQPGSAASSASGAGPAGSNPDKATEPRDRRDRGGKGGKSSSSVGDSPSAAGTAGTSAANISSFAGGTPVGSPAVRPIYAREPYPV